jgi:porin
LGLADSAFSTFDRFLGAGLNMTGPFAREQDNVGIAVAAALTSRAARRQLESTGVRAGGSEVSVELSYRAQLNSHFSVQPNVHYVINPGADRDIPDALILGLRASMAMRPFGR